MQTVRIYTKRRCWYCRAALKLLHDKGVVSEEVDVTTDAQARVWLQEATGQRTVPQVFIGEQSIGGYSELAALERMGELDPLLRGVQYT